MSEPDSEPEPEPEPEPEVEPEPETQQDPAFLDEKNQVARMTVEEQMFFCCANGNTKLLDEILRKADTSGLDIDATNSEGLSAMNVAVKNGFLIPVLKLLDHGAEIKDTLLRAVDADFQEAVVLLVDRALKLPRAQRDAILKCKCVTTDIHPDVTPIIRAAQKNSFKLVKVLHEAGARVEEFGEDDLETRASDSLQRSVGNLEIYRALASPAYVCFDPDPIGRAFHLSMLLGKLALLEVEFKPMYLELADQMEQYAADLMSHVVTSEEAMAVLAYHGKGNSGISAKEVKALGLLPTINRAIAHDQKKTYHDETKDRKRHLERYEAYKTAHSSEFFVAQPTCQHALRTQFTQQLSSLEDRPFIIQILVKILIIILFPVLCVIYKLGISSACDRFVKIPLVKFFLQLSSDLFLLGMIMYEITRDKELQEYSHLTQEYSHLTLWHYLIYVHALGMLWREILYMWKKRHQRNVVKFMNFVNMLIGLLLVALVSNQITMNLIKSWKEDQNGASPTPLLTTTPVYNERIPLTIDYSSLELNDTKSLKEFVEGLFHSIYTELKEAEKEIDANFVDVINQTLQEVTVVPRKVEVVFDQDRFHTTELISRSIMSLIVVISFSRIQPFLIAIDSVGPFSISFKSMFVTTSRFFSVVVAVLVGFATGLTFIYRDSYGNGGSSDDRNAGACSGGRGGSCGDTNYYESLVQSIATLYWSLFGLIPAESVESDTLPKVLESMGELLYASFYVFSVLVLLNALIAVMSNVYNVVEENADTEWKFHRTYLWMSFLDESFTVPPPFNLMPQFSITLKNCWQKIKRCSLCMRRKRKSNSTNGITAMRDEISMDSMNTTDDVSPSNTLDSAMIVDERSYKRVMMTLVERYIAERTSHERKLEGDITIADMRNLKNDVVGLRYNLFKEVWCINEKLQIGTTESNHIDTEMTSVIDVFNALAKNKEDLEKFERDVNRWLMNLVERLKNLPDIESLVLERYPAHKSIRKSSNTVEEMVDYYESLKRRKTRRNRKRQLMRDLLK